MIKKHYNALTNFSKHVHFSSSTNFSKHVLFMHCCNTCTFFRRGKKALQPPLTKWTCTRANYTICYYTTAPQTGLPWQQCGVRWGWWGGQSRKLAGQGPLSWWTPRWGCGTCNQTASTVTHLSSPTPSIHSEVCHAITKPTWSFHNSYAPYAVGDDRSVQDLTNKSCKVKNYWENISKRWMTC